MNIEHITDVILHTRWGAIIASITGVFCMSVMWMPASFSNFQKYKLIGALAIWGAVGGFFLTGAITNYFGVKGEADYHLAAGFFVGLTLIGTVNLIAALFKKMEDSDQHILDVLDRHNRKVKGDD